MSGAVPLFPQQLTEIIDYVLHFFQTLSQSLKLADQNFEKLKTESDRLEQHAKKSVNWILWIMLIFVCFTFISMILFIRLFPRLR